MTAVAGGSAPFEVTRSEVETLARDVGHAFYLLDLDRVRENHDLLLAAFRRHYADTVLAYSVKTNYMPCVLALIRELGSMAEVVSEFEYEIVSRVGFKPAELLINGPLHESTFLEQVLALGLAINLDGWYMLEPLHRLCSAHPGRRFRVGLRLNYPIPGADWSRFGFEATETNMRRLAAWFRRHPNCEVAGLHSHFPLAPKCLGTFEARMERLVEAAHTWFPETTLRYLDLGGGMGARVDEPFLAKLSGIVARVMEKGFAEDRRPTLFIEPGSAIIASAMAFVCRVYDVKRVRRRTLALVNGSNLSINTMMWHSQFAVRLLPAPGSAGEAAEGPFDIVGNTCMERKDLMCRGLQGPVMRGDYVVFHRVGAYSTALKPPFIHTCPAVVARHNGKYDVVKRRETTDDVLRTFCR